MSGTTILDDRALTNVTYAGRWTVAGTAREHNSTTTSSLRVGDRFVVSFTGTGISVFGTTDASSAGVIAAYAIDGGVAQRVTTAASPAVAYKQLFWKSGALTPGPHKLAVRLLAVNTRRTIWFDYFSVVNPVPAPVPAANTSTTSITPIVPSTTSKSIISTTSIPVTTPSASATKSIISSPAAASSTDEAIAAPTAAAQSPIGTIVGAVLGGMVVIFAMIMIFMRLKKRRARRASSSHVPEDPSASTQDLISGANYSQHSLPPSNHFDLPSQSGAFYSNSNPSPVPMSHIYPFAYQSRHDSVASTRYNNPYAEPPATWQQHSQYAPSRTASVASYGTPLPNPYPHPEDHRSGYGESQYPVAQYPAAQSVASYGTPLPNTYPHSEDQRSGYGESQYPAAQYPTAQSVTSHSNSSKGTQGSNLFYVQNGDNVMSYSPAAGPSSSTTVTTTAPAPLGDSIAELKQRQRDLVASQDYDRPVQHLDSGVRQYSTPRLPEELPPVYSPN